MTEPTLTASEIFELDRPEPHLMYYYAFGSMLLGPLFFVALIPLYFRYRTLHFRFDDEGVSMRWGILFRREINLTYTRIQDIHLVSNAVERWLGLARIKIQTASGSAKAEMTIEGFSDFAAIRDFLYDRMRGTRPSSNHAEHRASGDGEALQASVAAELTSTLGSVAEELRSLRLVLEQQAREDRRSVHRGVADDA